MRHTEEKQASLKVEAIIALVYAVLVVGTTVFFQNAVHDFLDDFEKYVGELVVVIFSFLFATLFTGICKAIIGFAVGKHFLNKYFVIFACIFLFIVSLALYDTLLLWWATALSSIFATFVSCIKMFVKREVKKKVNEIRELEHDLRKQSMHDAKYMVDKLRGKR